MRCSNASLPARERAHRSEHAILEEEDLAKERRHRFVAISRDDVGIDPIRDPRRVDRRARRERRLVQDDARYAAREQERFERAERAVRMTQEQDRRTDRLDERSDVLALPLDRVRRVPIGAPV
jgi:hypothetical protein